VERIFAMALALPADVESKRREVGRKPVEFSAGQAVAALEAVLSAGGAESQNRLWRLPHS
jgi:hypothetical protein